MPQHMTRAEHLKWAKDRALAYLKPPPTEDEKAGVRSSDRYLRDGYYYRPSFEPSAENLRDAISSILSDLGKHPETSDHMALRIAGFEMLGGRFKTAYGVRDFIEGIN